MYASKTNIEKQANLADEFFSYIHVAPCQRLFFLEWYDNCTYVPDSDGFKKPLPIRCCNELSCLSPELSFMQQEPFIKKSTVKRTETDRE